MDTARLSMLVDKLGRPDLPAQEREQCQNQLRAGAREIVSFLPSSPSIEHILICCQFLSRLNNDYCSLFEVQTVLPDLIKIIMEPKVTRNNFEVHNAVVNLFQDIVLSQFLPKSTSTLHIFITDTLKLILDLWNASMKQEAHLLNPKTQHRRLELTVHAYAAFYALPSETICETAKQALTRLDASHLSKNAALSAGLFGLLFALLSQTSGLPPATLDFIWSSLTQLMRYYTQNILDAEPTNTKILSMILMQGIFRCLLYSSSLPSSSILSTTTSEMIQTSIIALFTPQTPAALHQWAPTFNALAENLSLFASHGSFTLAAFPQGFIPKLAASIDHGTNRAITSALLGMYYSRTKKAFLPPNALIGILQALPLLLHLPELQHQVRQLASFIYSRKEQIKSELAKQSTHLNRTALSLGTLGTATFGIDPFSTPLKKFKLGEPSNSAQTYMRSEEEKKMTFFFNPLCDHCAHLYEDYLASKDANKATSLLDVESRAISSYITLLWIHIDNLEVSPAKITNARRQGSSRTKSNDSSQSAIFQTLTDTFVQQTHLTVNVEAFTQGVIVTVSKLADHFVERLQPPKLVPSSLLPYVSRFMDAVIHLVSLLPPHESQLTPSTNKSLRALCDLAFGRLSLSRAPSMMIATPHTTSATPNNQSSASVPLINIQTSDAKEVLDLVERSLILYTFLYRITGEPHTFTAALTDTRPGVVQLALRYFPVVLTRVSEAILQNGEFVKNFLHVALQKLNSLAPFPKTASSQQLELLDSVTSCISTLCCAMAAAPVFGDQSSDETSIALCLSSPPTSPHPFHLNIACSGHCTKYIVRPVFWTSTQLRIKLLSRINLEWQHFLPLLSECFSSNVDPAMRAMLLHAFKSLLYHRVVPAYSSANNLSLSRTGSGISVRSRDAATRSPSKPEKAQPIALPEPLPNELTSQISKLFHLALHGPTPELRNHASEAIVLLIEPNQEKLTSAANNAIMSELQNIASSLNCSSSQTPVHATMQEDTVDSEEIFISLAGKIGGSAQGWYVLAPLVILLNYLTDTRVPVKAAAFQNICRISVDHNMEPKELLTAYEPKICVTLVKGLRTRPSQLIDEVCSLILRVDPAKYILSHCNTIMPKIALKKDDELLQLVSQKTSLHPTTLLIDHMSAVLVATVCLPNVDWAIVKWVVDNAALHVTELFRRHHLRVLRDVLLQLGHKSRKEDLTSAVNVINLLLNPVEQQDANQAVRFDSPDDLIFSSFLSLTKGLILDHMLKPSATHNDKLQALLAYKRLVKLLGRHIDKCYVLISHFLRLIMSECPELHTEIFKTWKSFLKQVPDNLLGPILGSTTLYLTSYSNFENEISPILEYLFLSKERVMAPFFTSVPVIPDRPSYAKVRAKWSEAMKEISANSPYSEQQRAQLIQYIEFSKNDDGSVREASVRHLINILRQYRSELWRSILTEGSLDSTIVDLAQTLIQGSREPTAVFRLHFAKALGEMGAIDPARLKLSAPVQTCNLDLSEVEFVVELIEQYLIKAYRTARNVRQQEYACITLQHVLAAMKCTPATADASFARNSHNSTLPSDLQLWKSLGMETRSLAQPFLASIYRLDRPLRFAPAEVDESAASMIVTSCYEPGLTYSAWVELWAEKLIVESKKPLFSALRGILHFNHGALHFVLPHLVLHVMCNGSNVAREELIHEFLVVLGARAPGSHTIALHGGGAESMDVDMSNHVDSINSLAAQRVFILLDCLTRWLEARYKQYRSELKKWKSLLKKGQDAASSSSSSAAKPKLDPRTQIVENLFDHIPQIVVARTALGCHAYSRALWHFESAARVSNSNQPMNRVGCSPPLKPITDSADIALLQQIYAGLDEPDLMEGLAHMKAGKQMSNLVEEYRAAGRWNEALIALDQLLRQNQGNITTTCSLQSERLDCLAELGLFDQMLSLATSCMNDPNQASQPKHMNTLRSYAAQAAWKLGDWNTVEKVVSESKASSASQNGLDFDITVSQLFLALRNGKRSSFDNAIKGMRDELMLTLSAASMESYQRAYPTLVKLHLLSELEDGWDIVYGSEHAGGDALGSQQRAAANGNEAGFSLANVSVRDPDILDRSIGGLMQTSIVEQSVVSMRPDTPILGLQGSVSHPVIQSIRSSSGAASSPHGNSLATELVARDRHVLLGEWRERFEMTQFSYKVRESILSLRLAVFGLADMQQEASESWLKLAQISRKTGRYTMAQYAILKVREKNPLSSALESAKLQWASGFRSEAIVEVQKLVEAGRASLNAQDSDTARSKNDMFANASSSPLISAMDAGRSRVMTSEARSGSGLSKQGGQASSSSQTRPSSKSSINRKTSRLDWHPLTDAEIFSSARTLLARWMHTSQYSVDTVKQAFTESTQNQRDGKSNYFAGVFMDHLAMEYKRRIYSMYKPSSSSKSANGSSSSSSTKGFGSGSKASSSSKGATASDESLPPLLMPQASQYWQSIQIAMMSMGRAVIFGAKYSYQVLPRVLSVLYECSDAVDDLFVKYSSKEPVITNAYSPSTNTAATPEATLMVKVPSHHSKDKEAKVIIDAYLSCMRLVHTLQRRLPSHVWLSTIGLVISGYSQRNNKDVEDLIGQVLRKVLEDHPQQTIWHIYPLTNLSEERKYKFTLIRKSIASSKMPESNAPMSVFFDEATAFCETMDAICNHPVPKNPTVWDLRLSEVCQMEQKFPKELIVPTEQQLGSSSLFIDASSKNPQNPFSHKLAYIRGANPKLTMFRSLARPRKLILIGSDAAEYWFLCKPSDDLRKDARMMEVSTMVNRLLKKGLEARRRDLRIRTYAVLPFSQNTGILSWVPNTSPLRSIISGVYQMEGLDLSELASKVAGAYYDGPQKQAIADEIPGIPLEQLYTTKVEPLFPFAISRWFLQTFTEPSAWLNARNNFARSSAVMSIVGALLGLGDRHCENILIDSLTGDVIHVDLNCLFFRGNTFPISECVPFRLTRQFLDAFGIAGHEGIFRNSCVHTLRILRQHKHALLSILSSFVHDPLIEWNAANGPTAPATRSGKQHGHDTSKSGAAATTTVFSHERHNRTAVEILGGVSDRFDGLLHMFPPAIFLVGTKHQARVLKEMEEFLVPLSIEGYVDALIRAATSTSNMARMYTGWSPYL